MFMFMLMYDGFGFVSFAIVALLWSRTVVYGGKVCVGFAFGYNLCLMCMICSLGPCSRTCIALIQYYENVLK